MGLVVLPRFLEFPLDGSAAASVLGLVGLGVVPEALTVQRSLSAAAARVAEGFLAVVVAELGAAAVSGAAPAVARVLGSLRLSIQGGSGPDVPVASGLAVVPVAVDDLGVLGVVPSATKGAHRHQAETMHLLGFDGGSEAVLQTDSERPWAVEQALPAELDEVARLAAPTPSVAPVPDVLFYPDAHEAPDLGQGLGLALQGTESNPAHVPRALAWVALACHACVQLVPEESRLPSEHVKHRPEVVR